MKACLKQPSPMPSPALPDCPHSRKCVAFEAEGSEQVFFADEWDRTPTEPTRRLSYQDLMELREIQRSLPLANQPPDPITGRPGRHYLSHVPISLLPLLPSRDGPGEGQCYGNIAANDDNGRHSGGHGYPNHNGYHGSNDTNGTLHGKGLQVSSARTATHRNIIAAANKPRPAPSNNLALPPPKTTHNLNRNCGSNSRNGSYLRISNPIAQRPKTNFAFLPLLDSPAPSSAESSEASSQSTTPSPSNSSSRCTSPEMTSDIDHTDPPTPSLTNASLDSPTSCASSLPSWSPEPTFLQLPSKHLSCLNYGKESTNTDDFHFGPTDSYFPPYTGDADAGDYMSSHHHSHSGLPVVKRLSGDSEDCKTPPPTPSVGLPKKRNIIVVNGVEIDLDEKEGVEPASVLPPSPMRRKKNVIIVNDAEIELDSDEGEEVSTPSRPSDDAPSIHCNSTENLKPPENKSGEEIKVTSLFSPSPLPLPSSVQPLLPTSSTAVGRTTLNRATPCTRPNLGSTPEGESDSESCTALGLELNSGATSDAGRTRSKSTRDASMVSAREPSTTPRMEARGPSTRPSTGPSLTSGTTSSSSLTRAGCPCPRAAIDAGASAASFGSLHMPLRFKRHPAKVNAKMVSADPVISS